MVVAFLLVVTVSASTGKQLGALPAQTRVVVGLSAFLAAALVVDASWWWWRWVGLTNGIIEPV